MIKLQDCLVDPILLFVLNENEKYMKILASILRNKSFCLYDHINPSCSCGNWLCPFVQTAVFPCHVWNALSYELKNLDLCNFLLAVGICSGFEADYQYY